MAPEPHDPAAFWDDHYGRKEQVWSGRPNAVLVDEVADLPPGRALDLGCGEGGDAVWLASRGWQVTAVDVSQTALDRARRAAEAAGVGDRIEWEHHDLAATFPEGSYDLVSAQFLQSPIELAVVDVLTSAAGAVAPGGTLLVVSHAATAPSASGDDHRHDHHHDHPGAPFPDPTDTARTLGLDGDGWDLVACEVRTRTGDVDHPTLVDGIVRARRR